MLIQQNFQSRLAELSQQASQDAGKKIQNIFKHDNTGQISALVQKLMPLEPPKVNQILATLKQQVPEIATAVEEAYKQVMEAQEQQMQVMQAQQSQAAGMMLGLPPSPPGPNGAPAPGVDPQVAAAVMQSMGPAMKPEPKQKPPRRQGGV
jgi:DNA-binding transcriptional regulator YdaS (Cro superfamily)